MAAVWRLVLDGALDGVTNMTRDRAIQLAVERGDAPPTLRLYAWARPTASIGRFQSAQDVDVEACVRHGVDVVRRFTGGRGVLHDDELTYAVVARVADGIPRGVAASYRHLCLALAEAYEALGVHASLIAHERSATGSAACYLSPTRADLSLGSAKLSGSAQVWQGSTVLQHGSFVVTRDVDREAAVFGLDDREAAMLRTATATIESARGTRPDPDEVVSAVISAFERTLGVELVRGAITGSENGIATELVSAVNMT